jgi:ribonuclease BN (tRNA processing enzyme)
MKIKILGAHNLESQNTRCVSMIIDGILALDAGSLTSGLSFTAQRKLQAVVLTHGHYDHIRDIPALAINLFMSKKSIDIYSNQAAIDIISKHLLNGKLYPEFMNNPAEKPTIRFNVFQPVQKIKIAGFDILPVPVKHAIPTMGIQITSAAGKSVFYTSDTGPGLEDCWRQASPDLLITEVTFLNKKQEFAIKSGHLTASLLKDELESFRKIKGYLPRVLIIHTDPTEEKQTAEELAAVERALDIRLTLAREGMQIEL